MKYLIPLFFVFVFSCTAKKNSKNTYFGGKIINPKDDYVLFYRTVEDVDSIALSEDNTFLKKLKNIEEGLYFFRHGPEYQYVYFEPGDSLLIRLNTWDFDESIVYSGVNAERNNLLTDIFLKNEEFKKNFKPFYNFTPKTFLKKIDSVKKKRKIFLNNFKKDFEIESKKFLNTINISLKYPLYEELENYSIKKSLLKESLPNNYFNFRQHTNIDIDSIMFYSTYRNYVVSRLYADAYSLGHKENSEEFVIDLMNTIDQNIKNEATKSNFLRQVVAIYFFDSPQPNIKSKVFDVFYGLCTGKEDKDRIKCLVTDALKIQKGERLPNFSISDSNGKKLKINEVIKQKKAVLYFRNPEYTSDEWVFSRVKYLSENNPDIKFLIINLQKDNKITSFTDTLNQFVLHENSDAKVFLTSGYSRAILVDQKGTVFDGYTSLSSSKINDKVSKLQKLD